MVLNFKGSLSGKGSGSTSADGPLPPPGQKTLRIGIPPAKSLRAHLHGALGGERNARRHYEVHASDLDPGGRWCPREPALLDLHGRKRPKQYLPPWLSVTYGMGYAVADFVINTLPAGVVWGHWMCLGCGTDTRYSYKPTTCQNCGPKARFRYKEVLLRDPETGVIGSIDMLVDLLGNGKLTIVEIKSEGKASFTARRKADFSHEWRTRFYLYLASVDENFPQSRLSADEARILYMCKEGMVDDPTMALCAVHGGTKTPFKEYTVSRFDDCLKNQLDLVREYRQWCDEHRGTPEAKKHLPCGVCIGPNDTRANSCCMKKECFS